VIMAFRRTIGHSAGMRLFALSLLYAASACAQPALTDFIPPRSKVVMGVNLRTIIDSAILPDLSKDTTALASVASMLSQTPFAHLDPLKDVDSLLIASTGEGETPPSLAIIRGRFGALKLPTAGQYHGVPLIDSKTPKSAMALLDDFTLIAGDEAEVQAAIDRRGSPARLNPVLAARVANLLSKFDVWGTGDNPKGFQAAKGQSGGLDAVDHFEFGAAFHKGLAIEAEAHVRTAEDAKKLQESLRFVETLLSIQKTATNGSKFSLHTQNGTLKLSLMVPEEELKKAIAAQKTKMAAALPKPAPKPEPKPTRPEDVKIIKGNNGDTMMVILPGGKQD
jgi:hypothetical protein